MSNVLQIKFPEDFNEKYQEYRQVLLDATADKNIDTNKEPDSPKIEIQQENNTNENMHLKIETTKKLLLKEAELKGKSQKLTYLNDNLNLSTKGLMTLEKTGLIKLSNPLLYQGYINAYKAKRKAFELQETRQQMASVISPNTYYDAKKTTKWKNYLTDEYCNLGKGYYDKLVKSIDIEIDPFSLRALMTNETAKSFISFIIEFSPEQIQEFLDEKIDLFIKDELDLAQKIKGVIFDFDNLPDNEHKSRRFLSYEKQKEGFAIAITKQTNQGYPSNNLKIDYVQIWQKNIISQTNFLETALGMEREGLIEIRDIIEQTPKNLMVVTSDLFWKYPTIIQIKVLPDFNKYYEGVYKKYNPTQTTPTMQENPAPNTNKKPTANDLKADISIGKLSACDDGTIRYGNSIIQMRSQIKELCRYFMEHHNRLVTFDDIKENVIRADKRLGTPNSTIAKYVSELRKLLKIHFKKDVIPNQNEEGWYFKT